MILTLGNPQLGATIQVEIPDNAGDSKIEGAVRKALGALRTAGESAKAYTLDTETREEKDMRETMEEHQELALRVRKQEIIRMQSMLA